jgi:membrane protease YdiL (CAAX protease family)
MKQSFVEKHPYIGAFLIGVLCVFMTSLGMAISQIMGIDVYPTYMVATIFLILSVVMGIFIMIKSKSTLPEYGVRFTKEKSGRQVWWYVPLIIMEIVPLAVYGFNSKITVTQSIILVIFTIAVGFNEEIYFRGLVFRFLMQKGRKKAIIASSIIFGVLHLINALNGKDIIYVVLQMFFAFLVGFVLAEIVSITESLWLVIIWHTAHDFISFTTEEALDRTALIILAIQVVILLIYAIGIWKRSIKTEQI